MVEKNNILYFDNDYEFEEFAIDPTIYVREYVNHLGQNDAYADFELTYDYKDCLKNGKQFCIMDKKSKIYKRGCVTYKTMSKKIDNLLPFRDYEKD